MRRTSFDNDNDSAVSISHGPLPSSASVGQPLHPDNNSSLSSLPRNTATPQATPWDTELDYSRQSTVAVQQFPQDSHLGPSPDDRGLRQVPHPVASWSTQTPELSQSLSQPSPYSDQQQQSYGPSDEDQAAQDIINAEAAAQAETAIDVDSAGNTESESDAGYDTDSTGSASTSLSSSVRDYAFENGRRYHKFREGTYNFPNDDSEQDREDMKHAMMVNLCQTLHFAPIGPHPHRILDMGTGTGIWAIESEYWRCERKPPMDVADVLQWAINIRVLRSLGLTSAPFSHNGFRLMSSLWSTISRVPGCIQKTILITFTPAIQLWAFATGQS